MSCKLVIPGTFIACGEGGNYCSAECMVAAANEVDRYGGKDPEQYGRDEELAWVVEYLRVRAEEMFRNGYPGSSRVLMMADELEAREHRKSWGYP